ncbi:MAG: FixH family protein [Ferruginibacter sp.]
MNWGYRILIVYLAFVGAILFVAFKSAGNKEDLVTPDYYAKELQYQQRIDAIDRTNKLSAAPSFEVTAGKVQVSFPAEFNGRKLNGNITLYCPSDEAKDVKHDFECNGDPVQMEIPKDRAGAFSLQLNWQAGGTTYYFEKKIFI